jgi:LDH2 family malate/lactate/ureidoglycolate dehydrogenase
LTGANFGRDAAVNGGKEGQFFMAIDPEIFMPADEYRARMDALVEQVHHTERLPGTDEILVPGERGQRRRRELLQSGTVPLGEVTWQTMEKVCRELAVALPSAA